VLRERGSWPPTGLPTGLPTHLSDDPEARP